MASESGFQDWTMIDPAEVLERSGMRVDQPAGFSRYAASWHPAKWVWSLLDAALKSARVKLFTRTRVESIHDQGKQYRVATSRGTILARYVVYATESYTPALARIFHDVILPVQEQAASGESGPTTMKPQIGISGSWHFAGRYGRRMLFGSGSGVSFNAARCLVNRILRLNDEQDDYPPEYFAPSRLFDPASHRCPQLETDRCPAGE